MSNLKSFIFFISMVLLIYGGTNYYVYRRVVTTAHLGGGFGLALKIALLVCILAFPLARFTIALKPVTVPLSWIGGFWLAALAWAVIAFAFIDLVRLTDLMFGWFPNWLTGNPAFSGQRLLAGGAILMILALVTGRIIAANPVVRNVDLMVRQLPAAKNGYRIVLFSDVHLGTLNGLSFFNRIVNKVNSLNADLVLIPGDVFEESPRHLPWAAEALGRIRAKDAVVVSMGNHEYYAGEGESIKAFRDAGLTFLRDKAFEIPGTAVVAGMDDITGSRQYGTKPVPLKSYIESFDQNLPLIVLHHTPVRREEAKEAGADLMVSGHTHGGQQWPFYYITRMVFGVERGLTKFGDLNFFLSVGVGTWGPPIRLGATPEIVVFTLRNTNTND